MWVSIHVCVSHVFVSTRRGPQEGMDPLELEIQVVVSSLKVVLGTDVRSSARTASILLTTEPSLLLPAHNLVKF